MPTPQEIAESFRQLDFHDDTLVDLRVMTAQHPEQASVVEIQLGHGPGDTRVITFSGCANLRVAMDFDVLAHNLPPNTSRVDAHANPDALRNLMQSQQKDWDVNYTGTATSPLTKKLAALQNLVFFRVQFFGGAVDIIAREYNVIIR